MDISTLIKSCSAARIEGIELRVDHSHGIHLGMSSEELFEVAFFDDSPVEVVSMGQMKNTAVWILWF